MYEYAIGIIILDVIFKVDCSMREKVKHQVFRMLSMATSQRARNPIFLACVYLLETITVLYIYFHPNISSLSKINFMQQYYEKAYDYFYLWNSIEQPWVMLIIQLYLPMLSIGFVIMAKCQRKEELVLLGAVLFQLQPVLLIRLYFEIINSFKALSE